MNERLEIIKKFNMDFGVVEQHDFDWLISELERLNNWNKEREQLAIDLYKSEKENERLTKMLGLCESGINEDDETKARYSNDIEKLLNALREIDTHIRATPYPVSYIIETLKKTLPEYKEVPNKPKTSNIRSIKDIIK